MARAVSRLGLRGRLLAGFALVAVPPILLLGFASAALEFEQSFTRGRA